MESKQSKEIAAMSAVEQAFDLLDDGERGRVFRWLSERYFKNAPDRENTPLPTNLIKPESETLTIKNFVDSKKPKNLYQRLACLGYFLEKHQNKNQYKGKDLQNANTEARQTRIANMTISLRHATHTYGFFTSFNNGFKALSVRGENVVNALPNYDDVEKVLKSTPGKRRPKRKKDNKGRA